MKKRKTWDQRREEMIDLHRQAIAALEDGELSATWNASAAAMVRLKDELRRHLVNQRRRARPTPTKEDE